MIDARRLRGTHRGADRGVQAGARRAVVQPDVPTDGPQDRGVPRGAGDDRTREARHELAAAPALVAVLVMDDDGREPWLPPGARRAHRPRDAGAGAPGAVSAHTAAHHRRVVGHSRTLTGRSGGGSRATCAVWRGRRSPRFRRIPRPLRPPQSADSPPGRFHVPAGLHPRGLGVGAAPERLTNGPASYLDH